MRVFGASASPPKEMLWGRRRRYGTFGAFHANRRGAPCRSRTTSTNPPLLLSITPLIAVIEMSQSSWLVAGIVPGLERQPLKKLGSDEQTLLQLLQRWRNEAAQAGRVIKRFDLSALSRRRGEHPFASLEGSRCSARLCVPKIRCQDEARSQDPTRDDDPSALEPLASDARH